ncbi:MAG TPA: DnaB-like helicase C-terminal domain-containing protein, partial [Longimicrobium sp.]|nr:DnaB-like helicase C-terminal domain-containing protein [Longimicrobium sp.]
LSAALGVELDAKPQTERNPLTAWLDELALWGKGAAEKQVPAPVFTLRRALLARFINRLFATDGWATVLTSGQAQVGYASVSERLARQVQHLLLRFGVVASLRKRRVKYAGGRRDAWQLDVTDARSLRTFVREIGIFGKELAVARVERAVEEKRYQTNRDLVPREVWTRIADAKGDESWVSLARRAGIRGVHNIHVGQRALTRDRLAALAGALGDADLAAMADSDVYWDEVVSIEPLGLKQVYDLTVPGTHNFVANDVCVHNTAFTLNIAQHAAIAEGKCVAFFSLEMSKDSLVQRLLTSEARVDAGRVRTGRLRDDDYPRLAQAAGLLNTAPIFIDDTPGISVLEMRAKARRLKSDRDDLSMIIVDYLQLMTGGNKTENRQQEVSEISRGLKALAKELEVPVVALSQLSRAVESRPDKRPMMSDLRECVTGDTIVWLADGRRVAIRELVGSTPEVLSVSESGRIVTAESDLVWPVGRKPVFRVQLECGKHIRATAEHRLRGPAGWVHVSDIGPGDLLAVSRESLSASAELDSAALLQASAPQNRFAGATSAGFPASLLAEAGASTLLEEAPLREWAESDLFWDRVVEVVAEGEEEVFDLTVPETACWLADGIVSHNSGAIEQDADVIMFLFRPEYYHGPTDKDGNSLEGRAEVIIGKQRNGATGTINLMFHKEFTRFENFTRRADEFGG